MEKPLEIIENLLKAGLKQGVDEAEVYFERHKQSAIKVHQGKIESLSSADTRGVGIRVFLNGALGYSHTSDLAEEGLSQALEEAVNNARVTAIDEYNGLPETVSETPELEIYRPELAKTSIDRKIELALELEQKAYDCDPRISGSEQAMYADEESEVFLSNSKGFSGYYRETSCYLYLSVLAREDGETETGYSLGIARSPEELNPGEIAQEAARKATSLLGAKPLSTVVAPAIFDPLCGAQLIAVLSRALSGEAIEKGRSFFVGKAGQKIAHENISLVDDGRLVEGMASAPFDGEGVPTRRTELIKEGVLLGFLHNTYTARKMGVQSTGNARRHSYKSPPEVGPSNLFLLPGRSSFGEMLSQTKKGLYVLGLSGVHSGANPISGEFSLGAKGLWIEQGKLAYPVSEVTVAGDILSLLQDIEAVGSDLRFFPMGGYFGCPTIRVGKITIGGK